MYLLLRVLGIGQSAANVTVIGVALGLSYDAGLLIRDLNAGVNESTRQFARSVLYRACA